LQPKWRLRVRRLAAEPESSPEVSPQEVEFERWTNPSYSRSDLDKWWVEEGDAMLTVGSRGFQPSHLNSLRELVTSRDRVRIKFASDRIDRAQLSEAILKDEALSKVSEILDIRKRGLMIGRVKGLQKKAAVPPKLESHGLCLDHFSVNHSCRFGSKCKYSHDATLLTPAKKKLLLQHMGTMKPQRAFNDNLV
jgi:hypothetical protein